MQTYEYLFCINEILLLHCKMFITVGKLSRLHIICDLLSSNIFLCLQLILRDSVSYLWHLCLFGYLFLYRLR